MKQKCAKRAKREQQLQQQSQKNTKKMAQEGEKQRFLVKKKPLNFDKNKKSYIFAFRN